MRPGLRLRLLQLVQHILHAERAMAGGGLSQGEPQPKLFPHGRGGRQRAAHLQLWPRALPVPTLPARGLRLVDVMCGARPLLFVHFVSILCLLVGSFTELLLLL